MSLQPVRHIFVYGTLRRGEARDINRLLPAPRWRGFASVPGLMYQLGAYPGVVLGGQAWVRGDVYEIRAELERQLDAIEEVWPQQSGEYIKRESAVRLDGASGWAAESLTGEVREEILCVLYEIAPERTVGKTVIASGDWVQYRADGRV